MLRKKLFIGVLALGLAPLAFANGAYAPAPAYTPGIYVGIQGGYGMTGWDSVKNVIPVTKYNGLAGRLFAGYDFHKNFAIEGGFSYWFNQPKFAGGPTKAQLWALDLVGKIKAEVYENVELYAKAGIDYLHTKFKNVVLIPGFTFNNSYGNVNLVYGVGATYYFTPQIGADLSWTRYNGKQKVNNKYQPYADLFALGVSYKFNID